MGMQNSERPSEAGVQSSTATNKTPPANPKRARSPKHVDEDDNPRKKLHVADKTDLSTSLPASRLSTKPQTGPQPTPSPIDLTPLLQKFTGAHHVTPISVISSASIEKKVVRSLELLSRYPTPAGEPPSVVLLYAKATAAAKLITIVEIAKREIARKEGKWYQYTIVNSSLEERTNTDERSGTARKGQGRAGGDVSVEGGGGGDDGEEDEEEEEESFEVMKTPFERAIEGRPKVRAVPVMAVVLSRVRIDSLRLVHGEQSNGLPAS